MDRFRDMPRATVAGFTVPVAATRRMRRIGLAQLDREEAGEGLLIPNCKGVHTFGMRFDLDLLFLDEEDRVIEVRRSVPPNRLVHFQRAAAVLELPSP